MKKIVLATFVAAFAVPAVAAPGDTDTTQGVATAEIVAPISITHDAADALSFGTVASGDAGTVIVTQAGALDGSSTATTLTGSTYSADLFSVEGDPGRSFSITTTGGTVASGLNSMSFTTSAPTSGTLSSPATGLGTATFNVGGTLSVGASQAAGDYSGSYDATVTYN